MSPQLLLPPTPPSPAPATCRSCCLPGVKVLSDVLQSPPNHVIPQPEEIYIYCPLGSAFKVKSSEASSKNPSIVTM